MNNLEIVRGKLIRDASLNRTLSQWRFRDDKIVFTNGCLDVLHLGHLHLLAKASDLGQRLIVGLNSDSSVEKLKGNDRPIHNEEARALMLASFSFVHVVAVFEEETPYELIKVVQPDVLVKGGDYRPGEIVGADIVEAKGGRVEVVELIEGYSTTELLQKMK